MSLNVSVDLKRALQVLVEKQHLNQVHFAISLMRKAMRNCATDVEIKSKKSFFLLSYDGNSIAESEASWISTVLSKTSSMQERLNALSLLEEKYGFILLSLCLEEKEVQVRGPVAFSVKKGVFRRDKSEGLRTSIYFKRNKGALKEELRELQFYCAALPVNWKVNGKKQRNTALVKAKTALLEMKVDNAEVQVFWNEKSTSGIFKYFKHGIYFGIGQRSGWPLPFEMHFNSLWNGVEDNFRDSIKIAKKWEPFFVQAAIDALAQKVSQGEFKFEKKEWVYRFLELPLSFFSESCAQLLLFSSGNGDVSFAEVVKNARNNRVRISNVAHDEPDVLWVSRRSQANVMALFAAKGIVCNRVLEPLKWQPRREVELCFLLRKEMSEIERRVLGVLNKDINVNLMLLEDDGKHAFLDVEGHKVGFCRGHHCWIRSLWAFKNAPHELPLLAAVLAWPQIRGKT